MTPLERAERRMRQRWYDLALADSQDQPAEVLRQRYESYLAALRSYTTAFEADAHRAAFGDEARRLAS